MWTQFPSLTSPKGDNIEWDKNTAFSTRWRFKVYESKASYVTAMLKPGIYEWVIEKKPPAPSLKSYGKNLYANKLEEFM